MALYGLKNKTNKILLKESQSRTISTINMNLFNEKVNSEKSKFNKPL